MAVLLFSNRVFQNESSVSHPPGNLNEIPTTAIGSTEFFGWHFAEDSLPLDACILWEASICMAQSEHQAPDLRRFVLHGR